MHNKLIEALRALHEIAEETRVPIHVQVGPDSVEVYRARSNDMSSPDFHITGSSATFCLNDGSKTGDNHGLVRAAELIERSWRPKGGFMLGGDCPTPFDEGD
jgi:hypothetical protein